MIYLDNAATTIKKPDAVYDAVLNAMKNFGNSGRSAHESSFSASRTILSCREKMASLVNLSRAENVIFTCNATEALNIAIQGVLEPGDHAISTDTDHNSVLRPLYAHGNVSFLTADSSGVLDVNQLESLIQSNTKAIICNHASNVTGNVNDIAAIGKIAKEHGLLFIVDASQSCGVLPIDMEAQHIDILCFTGHKSLMGPQGTGGLCIHEGVEVKPLKSGGTGVQTFLKEQPHNYPTRLEAGTLNSHGIAGLNASLEFIQSVGINEIYQHENELMTVFYEGVKDIPNVTVYGDLSTRTRAAVVSLNIGSYDSGKVSEVLMDHYEIATRSGAHCAPRIHEALGTKEQGAVRFSFGYYNTMEEVERAVEAVREIAT